MQIFVTKGKLDAILNSENLNERFLSKILSLVLRKHSNLYYRTTKTHTCIFNGAVYCRYGVGSTVFGSDCKVIESWRPVHTLRGHTGGKLHVFESCNKENYHWKPEEEIMCVFYYR